MQTPITATEASVAIIKEYLTAHVLVKPSRRSVIARRTLQLVAPIITLVFPPLAAVLLGIIHR